MRRGLELLVVVAKWFYFAIFGIPKRSRSINFLGSKEKALKYSNTDVRREFPA